MTLKDIDHIMSYMINGTIFCIWAGFTFLCFINMENYQEKPFEALVMAICGPFVAVTLGGLFCAIWWCRIDTRVNAIDKIGTNKSWDFFETMEMACMFNEIFE